MQRENSELVVNLIEYQLKAKDVLARAFIYQNPNIEIPQTKSEALFLAAQLAEENEKLKPKANKYDQYLNADGLIQLNEVAKHLKIGLKTFYSILRSEGVLMKQKRPDVHIPMGKYMNKDYFQVIREQVENRQGNLVWQSTTYATHAGFDFLEVFLKKFFMDDAI